MIKLSMEELDKVSGGSYVEEEYDRTEVCNNGPCTELVTRIELYDSKGNAVTPKYYCENCWLSAKRREEHFIKMQEKRNKRNYKKHRRIGQG